MTCVDHALLVPSRTKQAEAAMCRSPFRVRVPSLSVVHALCLGAGMRQKCWHAWGCVRFRQGGTACLFVLLSSCAPPVTPRIKHFIVLRRNKRARQAPKPLSFPVEHLRAHVYLISLERFSTNRPETSLKLKWHCASVRRVSSEIVRRTQGDRFHSEREAGCSLLFAFFFADAPRGARA